MQSMLWLLQIFIVIQIFMLTNFHYSESSHPSINFKWRKHNTNTHKNLIDEMSPSQYSRFQEEYHDNKIPVRHDRKFSKIDQVFCFRMGNCSTSPVKTDVPKENTTPVLQKSREPELESKLRSIRRSKPFKHDIDYEAPVIEDLNDFAAVPPNRSHLQEIERKKQNVDELSPVSKMKLEKGGSKPAVNLLFQQIYKSNKEEEAITHIHRALEEARCKKPTPIVISVSDFYPHPHKIYAPACTKLFRCSEMSGCCTEPKRCMPSVTENVTLYFKVFTQVHGRGEVTTIEALTFLNDTECRCNNKSKTKLADDGNLKSSETDQQDEAKVECTCPAPYSKRIMNDGTCSCDCFDNDRPCLAHKRGGLFLNSSEKKCVEVGKCTKPTCEHGEYLATSGRCPKDPRFRRRY